MKIPSNSQSSQKFVSQTLALSNGTQSSLLDFLGVKFYSSVTEFESLLYESSEFADTTSLISKDFLSMSSTDNDFCSRRGDTNFATRVTLFSEFAGEKFIKFGKEYAVGDELFYCQQFIFLINFKGIAGLGVSEFNVHHLCSLTSV